jgi:hypothetical protein
MNHSKMNTTLAVLGGLGAGAAAMYFLDPDRGTRRRALVRDKAVGLTNDAKQAITGKAKDLRNRASGLAHEAKGLVGIGNGEEKAQAGFTSSSGNGS